MRSLAFLWPSIRPYRHLLVLGALVAVAEVAIGLAQPWPLKFVVDGVLDPSSAVDDPRRLLLLACVALMGLVLLGALCDYASTRLLSSGGLRIGASLRESVFDHLNRLSLRFHGENRVGDLSARVTSDVDRAQEMVVQILAVALPNGLLLVGMVVVMCVLDAAFALAALAATPLLVVAVVQSTRDLRHASRAARKADGAVAAAATESLGAIHLVQAFSLEGHQGDRLAHLGRQSLDAGLSASRLQARFSPVVDTAAAVSTVAVIWFGANQVLNDRLSIGELLVFLSYVGSLYKPIKALAKLGQVVSKGMASVERLHSVLATEPQIADRPGVMAIRRTKGHVALVDVCFSYGREPVLRDVSLNLEPGQTVALIGPTGAGKSTIATLVARLADPTSGRVLFDQCDVRSLTVASVRSQVSMVLQDCTLLRGTLRDNIAIGRPDATRHDVERAARLALVDEFASRLPMGLDSPIGERGVNLSGGQRQRVAIARAILRDSPILILDEPTSALDAASEELLVAALSNLPRQRTTLVIAHRLSTIRTADRIAVIEAGRVVQEGTHAHLSGVDGMFRTLHAAQHRAVTDSADLRLISGASS